MTDSSFEGKVKTVVDGLTDGHTKIGFLRAVLEEMDAPPSVLAYIHNIQPIVHQEYMKPENGLGPNFVAHDVANDPRVIDRVGSVLMGSFLWASYGVILEAAFYNVYAYCSNFMTITKETSASTRLWRRKESTRQRFVKHLKSKDYVLIGSGAFSEVYGRPKDNYVIKIGKGVDRWVEYVLWATKNGYAGTYAPVIHSLKVFPEHGFYVAKMEKLDHTLRELNDGPKRNKYIGAYEAATNVRPLKTQFSDFEEELREARSQASRTVVDRYFPGLCDFFVALKRDLGESLDAHNGNAMTKGDRLVIIDPLAGDIDDEEVVSSSYRIKDGAISQRIAA